MSGEPIDDPDMNGYYDEKRYTEEQLDKKLDELKDELEKLFEDKNNQLEIVYNYLKNNQCGLAMEYLKGLEMFDGR